MAFRVQETQAKNGDDKSTYSFLANSIFNSLAAGQTREGRHEEEESVTIADDSRGSSDSGTEMYGDEGSFNASFAYSDSESFSVQTPSIGSFSVQTPSVHSTDYKDAFEHVTGQPNGIGTEDTKESDDFFDDFNVLSDDILRSRSVGLSTVLKNHENKGVSLLPAPTSKPPASPTARPPKAIRQTPSVIMTTGLSSRSRSRSRSRLPKDNQRGRSKSQSRERSTSRARGRSQSKVRVRSKSVRSRSSTGNDSSKMANVEYPSKFQETSKQSLVSEASTYTRTDDTSQYESEIQVKSPPVSMMGGLMRKAGIKHASKKDLKLREQAEDYLSKRMYDTLATFVQQNPKVIGIQATQPNGQTLLHVMANQTRTVPENVVLKILSHDTSTVGSYDDNGNTPLHCAARNLTSDNIHIFLIYLKFHPVGASEQNNNGDLPLHLAAGNPDARANEAVHLLLEAFPRGISHPNKIGRIPLHLALTSGSENTGNIREIVRFHKYRKNSVSVLDSKGTSPLHAAIIHGASYDAIQVYNNEARDCFISSYTQENENGYLPLHLALMTKKLDPRIVLSLVHAAPYTGGMPTPQGEMPIVLATKSGMEEKIIKPLLASDLPIEIGNSKNNHAGMGKLVERAHGHSWWHVAVECQGKYVDLIHSLLAEKANFVQIIALARSLGPDNKTVTIHAATASLEASIKNLLRFYYRYELVASKMPIANSEVQSFPAIDHGIELEQLKVTGPWLDDGFTTVQGPRRKGASNGGHEVNFQPWRNKGQETTLRCYAYDDAFRSEQTVREKYGLDPQYFENIIHVHSVENYVNASFTTGKLLCIAFERNEYTLRELFNNGKYKRGNWLLKSQNILINIARALDHLHRKCLLHGNLDPSNVAKFGNKWKLLDIGSISTMGDSMSGTLRKCIPPEALFETKMLNTKASLKKKKYGKKDLTRAQSYGGDESTSDVAKRGGKSKRSFFRGEKKKKKLTGFVFNMDELGLSEYGDGKISKPNASVVNDPTSKQGSIAGRDSMTANTDEGSLRIIAMQEDEIARLRRALDEKEHVYRRQLAEERATFKRQEIERQREMQSTGSSQSREEILGVRFSPEKVMASAVWDVWSLGLIMAELFLGQSTLLPSTAQTDEEFISRLKNFDEIKVAAISGEVHEVAGELAADMIARLLHPKPQQRIQSMSKVLQHKYFCGDSGGGRMPSKTMASEQLVTGRKGIKVVEKKTQSKKSDARRRLGQK